MDFAEVIRRRRMVRNYTTDDVDPAAVDRIVEAGRRAPSAGFSQGMYFVVVTEPGRRAEVARLAGEEHYVGMGMDPWISKAPVHIVVCTSEKVYRDRYSEPDKGSTPADDQEWPVPYWWVDAGAAMQNILLAAVDEGLAAGFLGSHNMPDLKTYLGIPDHVEPIGIVTNGHPAPDHKSPSLKRGWKPLDEVVHRERWDG